MNVKLDLYLLLLRTQWNTFKRSQIREFGVIEQTLISATRSSHRTLDFLFWTKGWMLRVILSLCAIVVIPS